MPYQSWDFWHEERSTWCKLHEILKVFDIQGRYSTEQYLLLKQAVKWQPIEWMQQWQKLSHINPFLMSSKDNKVFLEPDRSITKVNQ